MISEETLLKAIRKHCFSCALTKEEVLHCDIKDCALWPYRVNKSGGKEGKKVLRIEPKSVSGLLFNL